MSDMPVTLYVDPDPTEFGPMDETGDPNPVQLRMWHAEERRVESADVEYIRADVHNNLLAQVSDWRDRAATDRDWNRGEAVDELTRILDGSKGDL